MNINAICLQITNYCYAVQTDYINPVVSAASSVIFRMAGFPALNNTSNGSVFKEKGLELKPIGRESFPTNGILTNFLSSEWHVVKSKDHLIPHTDNKKMRWGESEELTFTSPLSKEEQKELAQPTQERMKNESLVKAELIALMTGNPDLLKLSPGLVNKMRYQNFDTMRNMMGNQRQITSLAKIEESWCVVSKRTIEGASRKIL